MNLKSLKTQFIGAIAMVLVAAIAMGSSTFAWFAMNSEVSASAMQLKATTDANLYIAKGASVTLDSITDTAVTDLAKTALAVKPCEMTDSSGTVTVKDAATFTTDPTVSAAGAASTYYTIGTVTSTNATNETGKNVDNYAAVSFVSIARKQTVPGTYKLTPTVDVTLVTATGSTASNLNKALRAGIIINGKLYESNDDGEEDGTFTFTFSDITGLSDNTAYSAALLFWFEGEDSDCFVNNATSLSQLSAQFNFTSTGT